MYRLEIVAGRTGLDFDHILWRMFRLVPSGQTETTTIYACRLPEDLNHYQREILTGFVEEEDIVSFVCERISE